jgi:hypothetical protein
MEFSSVDGTLQQKELLFYNKRFATTVKELKRTENQVANNKNETLTVKFKRVVFRKKKIPVSC